MKPHLHARNSANRFGGVPEDYQAVHDLIDSSKAAVPDMRHRAVFHSAFGIYVVERVFGVNLRSRDGNLVSVRDVAEQHVLEDLGKIPTLQDYLENMGLREWMGGPVGRKRFVPMGDLVD